MCSFHVHENFHVTTFSGQVVHVSIAVSTKQCNILQAIGLKIDWKAGNVLEMRCRLDCSMTSPGHSVRHNCGKKYL